MTFLKIIRQVSAGALLTFLLGCSVGGVELTKPAVFCESEGQQYSPGEPIPLADGCNACICTAAGTVESCTEKSCEPVTGFANPAAVKCSVDGFHYEIRDNADGSQSGTCIDPSGKECDGWAYFRGECLLGDETRNFSAELAAMAGEGTGNAEAVQAAEKFTLSVSANLPPLPEGGSYEVQLTRVEPFDQISVGRLVPEGDSGEFALSFESPDDFADYGKISVVLKSGEDSTTVLEGNLIRIQDALQPAAADDSGQAE